MNWIQSITHVNRSRQMQFDSQMQFDRLKQELPNASTLPSSTARRRAEAIWCASSLQNRIERCIFR